LATKPNFFIVGAPKCGTTALYEYLRPHPNVFMPELKEPHFFTKELAAPKVKTLEEYTRLFAECTNEHTRIGEASASYLSSSTAIPGIREFNPDAKLIAMLRNPVDMVYSMHSQVLYWSEETERDFETAWRLQERRSRGIDLPKTCGEPYWVQYASLARFGTQVQRLLSIFPAQQVKVILQEDFNAAPARVHGEVVEFLGLPPDNRTDFPRVNEQKRARTTWLRNLIRKPPPALRTAFRRLKHAAGEERIVAIKNTIVDLNTSRERRPPLSPAFRKELAETLRDEVALLSGILNRDLSHWI
jgi:Sulfotransferase domain